MSLPWRNSASEMFVTVNMYSFDEKLRIFTFGFMSTVSVSNNLFISSIYNSPCHLYSNIWTWWKNLLLILAKIWYLEACTHGQTVPVVMLNNTFITTHYAYANRLITFISLI